MNVGSFRPVVMLPVRLHVPCPGSNSSAVERSHPSVTSTVPFGKSAPNDWLTLPTTMSRVGVHFVVAVTVRFAVAVLPPSVPVTVCGPATVAVHVAPVQEPSGLIVNVVAPVTSPRLLLKASNPCAV